LRKKDRMRREKTMTIKLKGKKLSTRRSRMKGTGPRKKDSKLKR